MSQPILSDAGVIPLRVPQVAAGSGASKAWIAAATMIGTTIEWYDFFIFGTATALVFNKLFFPSFDPVVATLASLTTFAVGLFARPLGAIIFGHYGDRIGRKRMLVASLLLMGTPTVLVGLMPTYEQIGLWAAVILIMIRLCQGIAIGGEWGGAVIMAVEHAPEGRSAFFGSMPQTGTPLALILSTLAFLAVNALPEKDFLSWGWRLPFLASFVLVLFGVYIRRKVGESPAFEAVARQGDLVAIPIVEVARHHWRNVALAIGAKLSEITLFYLVTVFILSYVTGKLGLPRAITLNATLLGAVVLLVCMPLHGYLADKVGPRAVFAFGTVALGVFAIPMFTLLDSRDPTLITVSIVVALGLIYPLMYAPEASLFARLFPARVRYTGLSISAHVGGGIGGGLAPLVATWLMTSYGSTFAVSLYLIALAVLAFACIVVMRLPEKE